MKAVGKRPFSLGNTYILMTLVVDGTLGYEVRLAQ